MGDYTDRFAGLDEELAEVEEEGESEEENSKDTEDVDTEPTEEGPDEVAVEENSVGASDKVNTVDEHRDNEPGSEDRSQIDEPKRESSEKVNQGAARTLEDSTPGFPFSESVQAQIYPRRTTHDEFEDFIQFNVRQELREYGIRNDEKREIHEAVLQFVMEHPEAVAEKVVELREQ